MSINGGKRMTKGFFEGKDYQAGELFKALTPKYYPHKYQQYIAEESLLLRDRLDSKDKVLDAGVGIGRLIPELAPIVDELIGVDRSEFMLSRSREVAEDFENVQIIEGNLEDLSETFPEDHFDASLCVWNTLGNVTDDVEVLKQLGYVTDGSIFITIYNKGRMQDRIDWYKAVDVDIVDIDEENEIFYSKSGLKSRSYSLPDAEKIASKARLDIKEAKILSEVVLWLELEAKG